MLNLYKLNNSLMNGMNDIKFKLIFYVQGDIIYNNNYLIINYEDRNLFG